MNRGDPNFDKAYWEERVRATITDADVEEILHASPDPPATAGSRVALLHQTFVCNQCGRVTGSTCTTRCPVEHTIVGTDACALCSHR